MAEVFINYRTGDGDEAAELIKQYLSQRFGKEHIFKASRDIRPGEAYPQALLTAVRHSWVLLAIMGPDWPAASQLRDADDWVRREILEAYASGGQVLPVLKGRKTDRLHPAALPSDMAWLAEVQSLRLDTRDSQADLTRIGDWIADQVPSLMDADRSARESPATVDRAANSTSSVPGPLAQSGHVAGNVNILSGTHGPVHTGKGNIYQNSRRLLEEDDQ